ncbi:Large ribosomal subunit protein uL18 - like 3 [Theobroma cacao]|nr:Large ribosomal subunit protein uL18 - like 3 [Theobroma cacao]
MIQDLKSMAFANVPALQFKTCDVLGSNAKCLNFLPLQNRNKQLYAMLVDDKNKKCLFYGSTLQKSIRDDPPCTTIEAAKRVGEKLVKACVDLNINEISYYDRNGFARGERMQAFEIAIAQHGFLPR